MGVVSFRLSDEEEDRLRRVGISPGAEAKAHILRLLRDVEIDGDFRFFDTIRIVSPRPTEELVREDREAH